MKQCELCEKWVGDGELELVWGDNLRIFGLDAIEFAELCGECFVSIKVAVERAVEARRVGSKEVSE